MRQREARLLRRAVLLLLSPTLCHHLLEEEFPDRQHRVVVQAVGIAEEVWDLQGLLVERGGPVADRDIPTAIRLLDSGKTCIESHISTIDVQRE